MGEYAKNPHTGEEIKIGVIDDSFFSKHELVDLWDRGFRGFYANNFDSKEGRTDSLRQMIDAPNILYKLPPDCPFDVTVHSVQVPNIGIEHDTVYLWKKGNRGSSYQYIEECKQKTEIKVYAVMVGERYDVNGKVRTLFRCDCCERLFSIDKETAETLRKEHPYWASWIHENPNEVEV